MDRAELVAALVSFSRPIEQIARELQQFPWDSEADLAGLSRQHLASVLRRFVSGELTAKAVENWANAVECRDDIAVDGDQIIRELLLELANPLLTHPLTIDRAKELLKAVS